MLSVSTGFPPPWWGPPLVGRVAQLRTVRSVAKLGWGNIRGLIAGGIPHPALLRTWLPAKSKRAALPTMGEGNQW
jgi:hypothetical protein